MFTKTDRVIRAIQKHKRPFTVAWAAYYCSVSTSTAQRAIARCKLMSYWQPDRTGSFSRVFFPLDYTPDDAQAYMDGWAKSGKSRAKLFVPEGYEPKGRNHD